MVNHILEFGKPLTLKVGEIGQEFQLLALPEFQKKARIGFKPTLAGI
jgi:hypothetical protein